jgi:hypothetical protein
MSPVVPFVAPIVVFGALTAAEGYAPAAWYVPLYAVKIAAVVASLLAWRAPLADIRLTRRGVPTAVLIGLAVFAGWVGIDTYLPYPHLGSRTAFDPFALESAALTWTFLAVRFFGLVLVVPVMEETFWRSFLVRYLTRVDFLALRVGQGSPQAFGIMVAASALAHPEWVVAALTSVVYGLLVRRTGRLFDAVLAHATTNAALGLYVVTTGEWRFW